MDAEKSTALKETAYLIGNHRLPRWKELPDLDIYMDQLISLITRYFEGYPSGDAKGITPSMVNNYVKQGIIPPPRSKKYNRVHLAYLIIICVLKTVLPIAQVGKLLLEKTEGIADYEALYDRFCDYYESTAEMVTEKMESYIGGNADFTDIVLSSALRAHAEQTVTLGLLKGIPEE